METKIFNPKTLHSTRRGCKADLTPKLSIQRSGKFSLNPPVWSALNSDFVEFRQEPDGRVYMQQADPKTGFKIRPDSGKNKNQRAFNSAALYRIFNSLLQPPAKQRVKSASFEVDLNPTNQAGVEVIISEPIYINYEFNPDHNV